MPPAIKVENLGKRYNVSHVSQVTRYRTLREGLHENAAAAPLPGFGVKAA